MVSGYFLELYFFQNFGAYEIFRPSRILPITITVHNVNGDKATVDLEEDDIFGENELNLTGSI